MPFLSVGKCCNKGSLNEIQRYDSWKNAKSRPNAQIWSLYLQIQKSYRHFERHIRELKIFHIFPDLISETKFGVIGSTCCSLSAVRLVYFLQAYFKEIIISVNYFRYDRDVFIAIAYGLLDPNFPVSARTMYIETFAEIC